VLLVDQSKALMELEERQIKESYQYAVAFMKSRFVLQRHQMMARHDQVGMVATKKYC
jgi:hypothetical protein